MKKVKRRREMKGREGLLWASRLLIHGVGVGSMAIVNDVQKSSDLGVPGLRSLCFAESCWRG